MLYLTLEDKLIASVQPLDSLSQGGMSTEIFYALLGGRDTEISPTAFPHMVDVRDAAEAHYQAIVRGAQGRFNLAGGSEYKSSTESHLEALFWTTYLHLRPSRANDIQNTLSSKWQTSSTRHILMNLTEYLSARLGNTNSKIRECMDLIQPRVNESLGSSVSCSIIVGGGLLVIDS